MRGRPRAAISATSPLSRNIRAICGPSRHSRVFGRTCGIPRARSGAPPGFTIVALLALTLGIAGNTTIFSLVDAVRVKSLPYSEPERLVVLWGNVLRTTLERRGASYPDFLDWREQARTVEGMAAAEETMMTLSGVGEATRIHVEPVSAAYFPLLRVQAAIGRTFTADEDAVPQKIAVAVMSDGFWKRRFGGDSSIVGESRVAQRSAVRGHGRDAWRLPRAHGSCRSVDSLRDERLGRRRLRSRRQTGVFQKPSGISATANNCGHPILVGRGR